MFFSYRLLYPIILTKRVIGLGCEAIDLHPPHRLTYASEDGPDANRHPAFDSPGRVSASAAGVVSAHAYAHDRTSVSSGTGSSHLYRGAPDGGGALRPSSRSFDTMNPRFGRNGTERFVDATAFLRHIVDVPFMAELRDCDLPRRFSISGTSGALMSPSMRRDTSLVHGDGGSVFVKGCGELSRCR